jgi:hypothetical protein
MILPALVAIDIDIQVSFAGMRPGIDFINDSVHSIFDMDRPGWYKLFMDDCSGKDLPVSAPDLTVAFFRDRDGTIRKNLETCFPGAQVFVFPAFPPAGSALHTAQYIAECLKEAGFGLDPGKVLKEALSKGVLFNRRTPGRKDRVVVHPGSGSPKKNYPHEFWADILQNLAFEAEKRELKLEVLLGPAEEAFYAGLPKIMEPLEAEISQSPDAENLRNILSRAAVFIGHDSGITHFAAMLGTPTLGLFLSTNIRQWRPVGPRVKIIIEKEISPGLDRNIISTVRSILDKESPV